MSQEPNASAADDQHNSSVTETRNSFENEVKRKTIYYET